MFEGAEEDVAFADGGGGVAGLAQFVLGDALELRAGLDDVDLAVVVDDEDASSKQVQATSRVTGRPGRGG